MKLTVRDGKHYKVREIGSQGMIFVNGVACLETITWEHTFIKVFFLIFEKMLFKPRPGAANIQFQCAIWAAKISGWYSIPNVHAIWAINEQRSLSSTECMHILASIPRFCTSERKNSPFVIWDIFHTTFFV